jgi:hypothetical protein
MTTASASGRGAGLGARGFTCAPDRRFHDIHWKSNRFLFRPRAREQLAAQTQATEKKGYGEHPLALSPERLSVTTSNR